MQPFKDSHKQRSSKPSKRNTKVSLHRRVSAVYEHIHRRIQIEILRHQLHKLPLSCKTPPACKYLDGNELDEDELDDDDIFYWSITSILPLYTTLIPLLVPISRSPKRPNRNHISYSNTQLAYIASSYHLQQQVLHIKSFYTTTFLTTTQQHATTLHQQGNSNQPVNRLFRNLYRLNSTSVITTNIDITIRQIQVYSKRNRPGPSHISPWVESVRIMRPWWPFLC